MKEHSTSDKESLKGLKRTKKIEIEITLSKLEYRPTKQKDNQHLQKPVASFR